MTREELLGRAAALVPVLKARTASCEAARSCPVETLADFRHNGLLRICRPARYGGFELGWDVLAEVVRTLARGCASQAWIAMILNDHSQLLGTFSPEAQDEVWGGHDDVLLSAALDPVGQARRVAGGAVYSGRHGFSSGIDHVQWVICGGRFEGEDGGCYFIVPKSAVAVIDDWQVLGLAGTGSKSFAVENVFVPAHRIVDIRAAADEGSGPGTALNRAPIYRIPRGAVAPLTFAAIAVGIGEAFIEAYCRYTRPRKSRGVPMADMMGTQVAIGRAAAEIEAAAHLTVASARRAMAIVDHGEKLDDRQKMQSRCNAAIAAQLAYSAVSQLYIMAGGRTLYQGNELQRLMRDMMGAASHHSLDWTMASANYGACLLSGA